MTLPCEEDTTIIIRPIIEGGFGKAGAFAVGDPFKIGGSTVVIRAGSQPVVAFVLPGANQGTGALARENNLDGCFVHVLVAEYNHGKKVASRFLEAECIVVNLPFARELVNGDWRMDETNPCFVPNGFGNLNSEITVEEKEK